MQPLPNEGILLIDKQVGVSSFSLVKTLRKHTGIQKIGHAGTLDPFATGVMVMLIGKSYTKKSNEFLNQDKEYIATIKLGASTDSADCEGVFTATSSLIPDDVSVNSVISEFQGTFQQIPPMFSAKKINGQKLYTLARKGISIERPPSTVTAFIYIITYTYPFLTIHVKCSKGTYIRTLANDIGLKLKCYGHLSSLQRTRSGPFVIDQCIGIKDLDPSILSYKNHLISL